MRIRTLHKSLLVFLVMIAFSAHALTVGLLRLQAADSNLSQFGLRLEKLSQGHGESLLMRMHISKSTQQITYAGETIKSELDFLGLLVSVQTENETIFSQYLKADALGSNKTEDSVTYDFWLNLDHLDKVTLYVEYGCISPALSVAITGADVLNAL